LDSEFLALAVVFIVLGGAGIVLFSGPLTPAGDSCYCPIPSPEPGAAQGTSSIFLALGIMFLPMGLMKGGLPAFRKGGVPAALTLPSGRTVTPIKISSGGAFVFGLVLLLVGADVVLVPGYLVLKNVYYELAGALLVAAGALSMYWGQRNPEGKGAAQKS
jgi:hypothetical protein